MSRIDEPLAVIGDLNAFEFSDGLVDVVGTIEGSPAPADEVTESSVDRWTHELTNLADLLPPADAILLRLRGQCSGAGSHARQPGDACEADALYLRAQQHGLSGKLRVGLQRRPRGCRITTRPSVILRAVTDLAVSVSSASPVPAGGTWTARGERVERARYRDGRNTVGVAAGRGGMAIDDRSGRMDVHDDRAGLVNCETEIVCQRQPGAAFEIAGSVALQRRRWQRRWACRRVVGSATSETETGDNAASAIAAVSNPAPTIAGAAPSVSEIRFRPHQFVPVMVNYTATDACGTVTTSLSVTSNEPVMGHGEGVAGLTSPDWIVVDDHHVLLRSERLPASPGRIYTDYDYGGRRCRERGDAGRDGDRPSKTTQARRF